MVAGLLLRGALSLALWVLAGYWLLGFFLGTHNIILVAMAAFAAYKLWPPKVWE